MNPVSASGRADGPFIAGWMRSAVAPLGGAFNALHPHEIAAPVLRELLRRARLGEAAVDAVVLGNALGAGGNPARMTALAANLNDDCAALTVDSQCCSGLDAVTTGAAMIAAGQAQIVIAGGVEAWSRSPIRMTRPMHPAGQPQAFERPAFAPHPRQDPDLLAAASEHAFALGMARGQLDAYALTSHDRALAAAREDRHSPEIATIAELRADAYPRSISRARAARMPVVVHAREDAGRASGMSALTISARADGAALVLLASRAACERYALTARARWIAGASVGGDPAMPLAAAEHAARKVLARAADRLLQSGPLEIAAMQAIELHDAFAVQGLSFCQALGLPPERINTGGGGLARGHPIGASGAIALVRLLATLTERAGGSAHGCGEGLGLAAIAGAGGIGAACVVAAQRMSS
ncbi:thiolase family protein [Diaphorobacter ruginosibacter]|uniref:thiolase family protein n=1 Tax=Diaphorobacter ruginosibacter TaxID=1715720 RepID=UPI0033416F7C